MKPFDLSLYLVTDSSINRNLTNLVTEAVKGGVTMVQLREKDKTDTEIINLGRELLNILSPLRIPLIINDSPEIAKAVGANGVHLGARDGDPKRARELLGSDAIIGLSVESLENFDLLDLSSVDYLAASPVFHTPTKSDIAKPLTLAGLRKLRALTQLPIVAIGGIHLGNVKEVLGAGADGIAVVSAICHSNYLYESARALKKEMTPRVLTIAGSDSGGGAGIQADLKTMEALGCYGMSAITALTSQNTQAVKTIFSVSPAFIAEQIEMVFDDIGVDSVKIGMLFSAEIITAVANTLSKYKIKNIVVDPVMVAKSGDKLLQESAIKALKEQLLPLATIVTPNLPEAQVLTSLLQLQSKEEIEKCAEELLRYSASVVIKGGHSDNSHSVTDFYLDRTGERHWISNERIHTKNTHGTGCTFSAAIASHLAKGMEPFQAVCSAREYLQQAIGSGATRLIGKGSGPVDHAWKSRRDHR